MISDERLEKALAFLVESAEKAAKARAERLYLEEYTKHLRAKLMGDCPPGLSLGAQEREACASDDYKAHLEGLRAAIEADEGLRFRREAEAAVIEAWRSVQANLRAVR